MVDEGMGTRENRAGTVLYPSANSYGGGKEQRRVRRGTPSGRRQQSHERLPGALIVETVLNQQLKDRRVRKA